LYLDRNGKELLEALLGAEELGLDKVHLMVEVLGLRVANSGLRIYRSGFQGDGRGIRV
jgi:hypothetical protein